MGFLVTVALLAAAVGCGSDNPPNVVLVVMDTVRADRTGGGALPGRSLTPTLDALAAEASVFTGAYANAPWTPPSHASMFTGLLPSGHGCTHSYTHLDPALPTLAGLLGARGYDTASFISNPWLSDGSTGLCRDFAYRREAPPAGGLQGDAGTWSGDQGGRGCNFYAREWLAARDPDRPFFMFVNFLEAHDPYDPAPPVRGRLLPHRDPGDHVSSLWVLEHQAGAHRGGDVDWQRVRELYGGDVATSDLLLRGLVENLRSLDAWENTVLIVTSDHGENLGEHGLTGHQFSVHETLLAVPLVVHAPGRLEPGTRADPVMLSDLFATVLDLAGADDVATSPFSRSLLTGPLPADRALVAEYSRPGASLLELLGQQNPAFDPTPLDRALRTVRRGDLRLTVADDGAATLHDVTADAGQRRDLATERPADAAALADLLDTLLAGAVAREGETVIDEATRQKLRSLGYVD